MYLESGTEYAVEVPGRGYVTTTWPQLQLSQEPVTVIDRTHASSVLADIKKIYVGMGCADVAETVRLISRDVTVMRGEWGPAIIEPEEAL